MSRLDLSLKSESQLLKLSIGATLLVATAGVLLGIVARSFSITFDGVYSLLDAVMTIVSLMVVQLINRYANYEPMPRGLLNRFSVGFWHLEPMVLVLNSMLLMGVSIYALLNAVNSLLLGGREIDFGFATIYAAITAVICFTMAFINFRANKTVQSEFLSLDAKAWIMSGGITSALLLAFGGGMLVQGTQLEWISPYIDPAVLAIVCLIIIPLPVGSIRSAIKDMLLIAPPGLKEHVDSVAERVVVEEGFITFRSYVAKVGRSKEITLYFIVPPNSAARALSEWDAIRDRIGDEIGDDNPNRWLTIVFTEDLEWA